MVEVAAGPFGNSEKVWTVIVMCAELNYWLCVANS